MAPPRNPLRNQCEEFVRAEIARVGVDGLDNAAIVRRFAELGAPRGRVHAWVQDVKRSVSEAAPEPPGPAARAAAADVEAAQETSLAAARDVAAVLDSLPQPAELAAVERKAAAVAAQVAKDPALSLVPDEARTVLDQVQTIMDTCNKVLAASLGADGKVRNAKLALNAVEALRRTLETALKLYESVNNVGQIETFMGEMLDAVRPLAPDVAQAVVARMRSVQTRWSRTDSFVGSRTDSFVGSRTDTSVGSRTGEPVSRAA